MKDELHEAAHKARMNLVNLESEVDNEISSRVAMIKEEVKAKYANELNSLRAILFDAKEKLRAEQDRVAALGEGGFAPVGSRYVEWKRERFKLINATKEPTGKVGIVECFTSKSAYHGGRQRPSIGTFGIRILKKDGTPSAIFEEGYSGRAPYGWYPEGANPNPNKNKWAHESAQQAQEQKALADYYIDLLTGRK